MSLPLASIIERDGPLPLFAEGAGWDAAQAALRDRGLADGLPQVVPTVRRLEAMLAGVRDPEQSLGMMPPLFAEGAEWDAVQTALRDHGLADGLPQVVPTARRLAAMLAGVRDPEQSLGMMPPLFGDLTPATVAY